MTGHLNAINRIEDLGLKLSKKEKSQRMSYENDLDRLEAEKVAKSQVFTRPFKRATKAESKEMKMKQQFE